ncbi:MAG: GcvT family protein [Micrococcaceae bacterium]
MPETTPTDPSARIVVIGAGVVGAALADELVARGAQNVTVVEQGPLYHTGGSSSHAPGFVFQTSPSRIMCQLAQRTMNKLDGLELDGKPLSSRVGGLELASTPGQLQELKRRYGFARAWGVPAELLTVEQTLELWPGLDGTQILGSLHTPTDGVVYSERAAEFQARRAEAGGATILGLTRVVDVESENGRVTGVVVEDATAETGDSNRRTLPADVVVAAGGIWGHPLAKLGGMRLPMHPMEHGFAWTAPVAELPGTAPDGTPLAENEPGRPIIRHQGSGLYFREFGTRIGIGAYEHRPLPLAPEDLTDTAHLLATGQEPAKRGFTSEDFDFCRAETARLFPAIAGLGLEDEFNGVFSFTPDGGPMLGPSATLECFWAAQAIWVTQSAGCAEVVAEWILTGDPGIDSHGLDLNRFDPDLLSEEWIRGKASESYDEVYDVHFPHQDTLITRGLKTSPFHTRIQDAGGVFSEANGWERPMWHEQNAALFSDPEFRSRAPKAFGISADAATVLGDPAPSEDLDAVVPVAVPRRDAWDQVNWSPIAAAEAWATRNRVALYDMSSLTRYRVIGAGATEWLEGLTSNKIGKTIGAVTYALLLDEHGGILSDVTVARLDDEEYFIGANGPLDLDRLTGLLPASGTVRIDDITTSTCCVGLWGPRARDVLEPLTEGDVSHEGLKYFRSAKIRVAGVPVLALRVSYVGELGWELYTNAAHGLRLWDALAAEGAQHGIVPAGRAAFSSLRLEKGYRSWGSDMTRENTPEDAGLGFAVRLEKGADFVGRAALQENPTRDRRLVAFGARMDLGRPESGAPVFVPGEEEPVGWVTSADFGYVTGQVIGLAWVPAEHAEVGTPLSILRFGHHLPAEVLAEPVYDASMTRIRR